MHVAKKTVLQQSAKEGPRAFPGPEKTAKPHTMMTSENKSSNTSSENFSFPHLVNQQEQAAPTRLGKPVHGAGEGKAGDGSACERCTSERSESDGIMAKTLPQQKRTLQLPLWTCAPRQSSRSQRSLTFHCRTIRLCPYVNSQIK